MSVSGSGARLDQGWDVGLKGDLGTMPLFDVLQWVSGSHKSGTLHVEHLSARKSLVLCDGKVHSVWSNDPRERLGRYLTRMHLITEDELDAALREQPQDGRRLGPLLLARQALTQEQLRLAIEAKAQEALFELFLWPSGRFEFAEGELPDPSLVSVEAAITPVILEGIRRVDEWERIRCLIPSREATFEPAARLAPDASDEERTFVVLAAEGGTLARVAEQMAISEFEAASLACELVTRGHLAVRPGGAAAPGLPRDAARALLVMAGEKLAHGRLDSARKAFQKALAMNPDSSGARRGLEAVEQAQQNQKTVIRLDGIPSLAIGAADFATVDLDPREGFVLSRVNGEWDVHAILSVCPMAEEETLGILARLLQRRLIILR